MIYRVQITKILQSRKVVEIQASSMIEARERVLCKLNKGDINSRDYIEQPIEYLVYCIIEDHL